MIKEVKSQRFEITKIRDCKDSRLQRFEILIDRKNRNVYSKYMFVSLPLLPYPGRTSVITIK